MKMKGIVCILTLAAVVSGGCQRAGRTADEQPNEPKENNPRVITDNDSNLAEEEVKKEAHGILVAVDPGHQGPSVDMSAPEPIAPGASEMKSKASSGTVGTYSGVPEYQLAMDISSLLREELEDRGYDVLLTRENNETAISNSERAILANTQGADISVRIHANGSEDSSVSGALALAPSEDNPYVGPLSKDSCRLAQNVLGSYCEATGMRNMGIQMNDAMTGINWSEIPVMILEMGFMSNEQDDLNMENPDFRRRMVTGIADGLDRYYGFDSQANKLEGLSGEIQAVLDHKMTPGEKWGVYVKRLGDGASACISTDKMQSASLIKLFTAACVYQNMEHVISQETSKGETEELLNQMISASDNDAANTLVRRLGGGNAPAGMEAVNSFCREHGYDGTYMGRLMLDFDAQNDNYTTPRDCGKLLETIYNASIPGSREILNSMEHQKHRGKIPAGIPENVKCANKTGELDDVENDAAIVYAQKGDYIICIMSQGLTNTMDARAKIKTLSDIVYRYMNQ